MYFERSEESDKYRANFYAQYKKIGPIYGIR